MSFTRDHDAMAQDPPRRDYRPGDLTADEVAERAQITAGAFRRYVSAHAARVPQPVSRVGRTPLWDPDEITTWITNRPGSGRWRRTPPDNPPPR